MNGRSVSEPTRERETFKYDPSLLTDIVYNDQGSPLDNTKLRTSHDAVLTSIASLGASRLNTAASLVSLFDKNWQYIVAEATQTLTLAPRANFDRRHREQLWLCGTAIPRVDGVCEHTLVSQNPNDFEEVGDLDDLPLSLVEDLGQDKRHCSKPWCAPGSPARFYAAVPIRSKRGINIGVYCVIDTSPRTDWNDRSTQTMRELSKTIMDYLELRRSKHEYRRSERMTRGLGSFVDGKATTMVSSHALRDDAGRREAEGALNANQQSIERKKTADADVARRDSASSPTSSETPHHGHAPFSTVHHVPGALGTPSAPAVTTMIYPPATERGRVLTTPALDGTPTGDQQSIKGIFSKAANIIRESIEIEGAMFLDASLKSFGGLTGAGSLASASSSDSSQGQAPTKSSTASQSPCCDVLAFSTSHLSSVDGAKDVPRYTTVPEKLLSALIRRYPRGEIFTFDENGVLEHGDSSDPDHSPATSPLTVPELHGHERDRANPWARHLEGTSISDIFQGARRVAFVPVWDSRKDRWYAGCFAFTRIATRIFTEGELSYLKAFSMLTMSETYRLEATVDNKAKSDALSSLSHELRSPLHGVILGVELLHDTQLDIFQGDVLHTVETCSRVLLDTVDHLLDFAKINNYKVVERERRKKGVRGLSQKDRKKTSIEDGMKSLVSDVRLDVIAEEVLESVAAGSTFQRMSIAQLARRDKLHVDRESHRHLDSLQAVEELGADQLQAQIQPRNVSVYLDIDPNFPWTFSVTPGAVRRILMNLFGNSLKYTREGTIRVSLTQEASTKKGRTRRRVVKITVADTGKGISEEFLRNDLFKPFSQEDSLAPGTGLGLSLVKQIVSTLGGTISIQSGINVGTKITVALPLTTAEGTPSIDVAVTEEDREFEKHVQRLRGLRVILHGFKTYGEKDVSDKLPDFDDSALIRGICKDWLGLVVVSDSKGNTNDLPPDLLLCTEAALDNLDSNRPPTVVVCANTLVAHRRATSAKALGLHGVIEFISQPTGPRRLARTLCRAYQQWSEVPTLGQPSPVETPHASARRLSDAPPTRPKLHRSRTTTDSWQFLATNLSTERNELKSGTKLLDINEPGPVAVLVESPVPVAAETEMEDAQPIMPTSSRSEETLVPTGPDDTTPQPAQQQVPIEFLLVDDNPINLKILSSFMKKLKFKYTTAADGQEAVDTFTRGRYQCVFMDISMPVMDGFEATRCIRRFEREAHLAPAAIFALSGLASADAQQEAFASGIDLFLSKPVRLKELSSILATRGLL